MLDENGVQVVVAPPPPSPVAPSPGLPGSSGLSGLSSGAEQGPVSTMLIITIASSIAGCCLLALLAFFLRRRLLARVASEKRTWELGETAEGAIELKVNPVR